MDGFDGLLLQNQLCFPIYSASNKILRDYKPLLKKLDLTYTQYIVMMIMWEKEKVNEKELSEKLFLKSNTLAPLLKKLIAKEYIDVCKNENDKRSIEISLTKKGKELREMAIDIPKCIAKKMNITEEEAIFLYKILYKMLKEGE